jgi:hypothetical protein
MNEHSENAQFARLIVALEPWLTQVVITLGAIQLVESRELMCSYAP